MEKRLRIWFLFILILLFLNCGGKENTEMKIVDVPVTAADVETGSIEEYVSSLGTIKPMSEADVITEASGFFKLTSASSTEITEGIYVKNNQIIARLENRELVNNARVESRKKAMETAEMEYEKQKRLYEKGGVTLKELQLADQNRVDARFNYEASLIMMDKLNVKAPISGILTKLERITDGDYVNAATVIGKIMDYHKVYVEVNVSNTDIAKINVSQKAKVLNYAIPDEEFIGRVTEISQTIDSESRTYKATVSIDNPERKLRPGMFVKVDIIVKSKKNTILVPRYAVLNRNNKDVVFIIEKQRAIMKEVVLGLEDKENVEILSGLKEGERIVVKGYETLKNKTNVTISK